MFGDLERDLLLRCWDIQRKKGDDTKYLDKRDHKGHILPPLLEMEYHHAVPDVLHIRPACRLSRLTLREVRGKIQITPDVSSLGFRCPSRTDLPSSMAAPVLDGDATLVGHRLTAILMRCKSDAPLPQDEGVARFKADKALTTYNGDELT
ncbi:hypothetical protein Bbelb_035870 [Branchiostoma belcheri]|nr:hypothetical protein Bbelb_035870 [Branchiostoma belcheri]